MNTTTTTKESNAHQGQEAAEWLVRTAAPHWLRLAGLDAQAAKLEVATLEGSGTREVVLAAAKAACEERQNLAGGLWEKASEADMEAACKGEVAAAATCYTALNVVAEGHYARIASAAALAAQYAA